METQGFVTAKERLDMLEKVTEEMAMGYPQAVAVKRVGISEAQYRKWKKRYLSGGFEALMPPPVKGRPPVAMLTDDEICKVKERIMGGCSETIALRTACQMGEIRAEVSAIILNRKDKLSIPEFIRRQIKVSEALKTYHHSPKAFRLKHVNTPRRNVTIENGVETPDEPGDSFVFDDMTINFAWWSPWPLADCECSRRYGVKVTRGQLLVCMDLVSLSFLHFALIARKGESYQANDIWAEYGRIFRTIGKPRKSIIHEGGHWTSSHIHGKKVELVGMDEDMRIGGLRALGIRADRCWTAKTKPIEARFDFLQNLMSELPGNLGRAREGEKEWKIYNRCSAGTLDPRDYLPSQTQMADKIQEIMIRANREPLTGRVRGIPEDLWEASIAKCPLLLPPADMGWIFARDARAVTLPSKPPIRFRAPKTNGQEEIYFDHECLLLVTVDHLKVIVHFDPLETSGDAVIISADPRSFNLPPIGDCPARTVRAGQVLCVARRILASARVSDVVDGNVEFTKNKVAAVRSEKRRITSNKSRATKFAEAYDGFGNAGSLEVSGDDQPETKQLLNPRPIREPALPARLSRPMPADPREEIRRLQESLAID